MRTHSTGTFQGKNLKDIEERKFYATFQRGDRVRTIAYCKLLKALSTLGSVVLADDWGDVIEKLPSCSVNDEGEDKGEDEEQGSAVIEDDVFDYWMRCWLCRTSYGGLV